MVRVCVFFGCFFSYCCTRSGYGQMVGFCCMHGRVRGQMTNEDSRLVVSVSSVSGPLLARSPPGKQPTPSGLGVKMFGTTCSSSESSVSDLSSISALGAGCTSTTPISPWRRPEI